MDNPVSPAPIPPKPPISLNLAFLLITLVSILLSVFFIYQNWRLTQKLNALVQSQLIGETTKGTLEATVIRSPTCPGAQRPGESCEAPVANETFRIIGPVGSSDDEIIQTITTNKDGKLTVSLAVGTYQLQSATGGIGKNIGNPNFTITSGKTTTQQFDIDTGIR